MTLLDTLKNPEATSVDMELALTEFSNGIQNKILDKVQDFQGTQADLNKMAGIELSKQERQYFNEVIDSGDGFNGVGELVPPTIISRVFDNLQKEHPLLSEIDMINVGLANEYIYSLGVNPAFWGALCADIQELQDKGFAKINVNAKKLSAYMPVCKAFLDLNSPEWLAQYVVTVLTEALALGLELGIVDGKKTDEPVGMRRSLANVTSNEHAETTATEIEALDTALFGTIMADLSSITIDGSHTITRKLSPQEVGIVVNPVTYWKEIFPLTTTQTLNGQYVQNLPLPFKIVQSEAVPEDELVIGKLKDYFLGMAMTAKIVASDEVRFIEDERVYVGKLYANGQPKADGMFKRYTLKKA